MPFLSRGGWLVATLCWRGIKDSYKGGSRRSNFGCLFFIWDQSEQEMHNSLSNQAFVFLRNTALVAIGGKLVDRMETKVMKATKPVLSSNEVKLLFALLDAAHDDGLLREGPLLTRWLAIKQGASGLMTMDRAILYRLMEEVDGTGTLKNTWMRERWLTVRRRVESDPVEFSTGQAPFAPQ